LWRLRDRHVKDAARAMQHMQKSMVTMNIQLSNAISDITGVTGQAIIRAILAGERNPEKLAKLRDRRIKATEEEVARSLEGNWREDMLFELRQAVAAYDFIQKQMAECDQRLQTLMAELPAREVEAPGVAAETAGKPARKKRADRKQKNAPRFDLHTELERICGVDLTSIDGINVMTAQTIVAELGTDFSRWQDEAHFASWLGMSPSRDISGGKVLKQGTLKVKNRVATALRTAANTLLHSDSYLGARFRSLRVRRGAPKAIKAMARYLACLIHRMFTRGQAWVDRGAQEFENRRTQRELSALQRKAAAHGFKLVNLQVPG
jgi:transposase